MFVRGRARALTDADIGADQIRPGGRHGHPEIAAVVLSDQDHPALAEGLLQVADQFDRVGGFAAGADASGVQGLVIGLAGAAAVPLHHHEVVLQRALPSPRQIHQRIARTAVQPEQDGKGTVLTADQDPLPDATERHGLQRGDGAPAVEQAQRNGEAGPEPRRGG